jgi:putative hemolysin
VIPLLYVLAVLAFLLLGLSVIETAITHFNQVELRMLVDKSVRSADFLEKIAQDRAHFLIPLQFTIQLSQIGLAVVATYLAVGLEWGYPLPMAFLVAAGCVLLLRQMIPKLIVWSSPEAVFFFVVPVYEAIYKLLGWVGWPLLASLSSTRRRKAAEAEAQEEPASEEEIQAFLEVGEDEGILEEQDTELIQSVVEFGDILVREVMTPRAEMTIVSMKATLEQLKLVMVKSGYSRIPVYGESAEQILGVISLRSLLSHYSTEKQDQTVESLIEPVMFTPETKRVRDLLRDLQKTGEYICIVVNEYGEVSGLVTVEDLVEEIVGEIGEKEELRQERVVREAEGRFLLRGDLEVAELEDRLGLSVDNAGFTTISGWVVNRLGRVPLAGEVAEIDGVRIEIVNADRRRIHSLRLQRQTPMEAPARESTIS